MNSSHKHLVSPRIYTPVKIDPLPLRHVSLLIVNSCCEQTGKRTDCIPADAEANILTCVQEQLDSLSRLRTFGLREGCSNRKSPKSLITLCNEAHIPVIVDPKGHRYSRYFGATVVTPNVAEANEAASNNEEDMTLEQVADHLQSGIGDGALLITRGPGGMTLFQHGSPAIHIPAQAPQYLRCYRRWRHRCGHPHANAVHRHGHGSAARLANFAAGIVVGKVGT